MTQATRLTTAVAIILLTITTLAAIQQHALNSNPKNVVVTEALKTIMSHNISSRYSLLTQTGEIIILENDQIEGITTPSQINRIPVTILSQAEINAKAEAEGRFLYLVLDEVRVDSDTAHINFYMTGIFDAGAGGAIDLTLENGIWVGEGGVHWIA